jgi:alpha-mannosidase
VIDAARDIREGANRYLWCVDRWVSASDGRAGMAVMPRDMPLISIGDPGIYRFSTDRVPTEPTIYSHLFNTQWGTNFPQWLEGDFSFRVTIFPHNGDWREGGLGREPWRIDPGNMFLEGIEGVSDSGLELDGKSVLLGVRPKHDGAGLIVRFWDIHGTHRSAFLKMYMGYIPVKRAWRCDLMEQPIEELRLFKAPSRYLVAANFHVAPYAVETLLLEFD